MTLISKEEVKKLMEKEIINFSTRVTPLFKELVTKDTKENKCSLGKMIRLYQIAYHETTKKKHWKKKRK
jgi:hypothetical protein